MSLFSKMQILCRMGRVVKKDLFECNSIFIVVEELKFTTS